MFSAVVEQVMQRVAATPLRLEPFEHLYVEEVFPPAIYAELQRLRLADAVYTPLNKTARVSPKYSASRLCCFPPQLEESGATAEQKAFWGGLFAAFMAHEVRQLWLQRFKAAVEDNLRLLAAALERAKRVRVSSELLLMRDKAAYALGPHTDNRAKLISVLFYLAPDESAAELGTTLYRPKDPAFLCPGGPHHPRRLFEPVTTLPYRPNTLLAFPKSQRCFHGVEPVAEGRQRDLLLYDIRCILKP
jgi:hypothetical protein